MFLSFEFGMVEGGDKSDHELRRKTPLRCPSRIAGVSIQSPCSISGALYREFNTANSQLSSTGLATLFLDSRVVSATAGIFIVCAQFVSPQKPRRTCVSAPYLLPLPRCTGLNHDP